jgi:DNA-binding NarL/FixJ family response regulator
VQAVEEVNAGKSVLDATLTTKLITHLNQQNAPTTMPTLSDREIEVLQLTSQGDTNKAIGTQLGISDRTVQGHLARIYAKLEVNSRTEAVMKAVSLGIIGKNG